MKKIRVLIAIMIFSASFGFAQNKIASQATLTPLIEEDFEAKRQRICREANEKLLQIARKRGKELPENENGLVQLGELTQFPSKYSSVEFKAKVKNISEARQRGLWEICFGPRLLFLFQRTLLN
ncbi:MAG: hypothetical protein HQM08_28600 [Candidatus Riflebacteria bacterium]|nr:hypothetical protein [Candidatus Riflebacteria bacterium]